MNVKISPSVLRGKIKAPASKSMAHRLLICAGLSEGTSEIENVAYSEDILATLGCLSQLGAEIQQRESSVIIKGVSPLSVSEGREFNCRESGSTLRFFIPLALLTENEHTFTGYGRLMERPMEVYEKLTNKKGEPFLRRKDGKIYTKGILSSGEYILRGDISSQFITGLLLALSLCEGDSRVVLTNTVESRSYINMTIEAMGFFGVRVEWENERTLFVKGSQSYQARNFTVEGDYSNAAFLEAFNALGGEIIIEGLRENSLQGDRVYLDYFPLLKSGTPELDISDCPDLAPILMTMAAYFNGCVLKGTRRLKIKESDRGVVMMQELSKFGADISVGENEIHIRKAPLHKPAEILDGHNDHRVVMSLAVLSSAYGGEISGADAVAKSYPDFFKQTQSLLLEAEINDS